MRVASWWEPLGDGAVKCTLCPVECRISEGKAGSCRVRKNIGGTLYTTNYGLVSAASPDPVEKKPLFHFWPGSCAFSVSTVGCNMHCKHCQNWEISQTDESFPYLRRVTPEELVGLVKGLSCESIAYTYNEPVVWYEFVLDTARLAREEGIYNLLITNGYINEEPFRELAPYVDAMNIDIKAFSDEFYMKIAGVPGGEPSRRTASIAKKEYGIHVELTYLIIPSINDETEEIRSFVRWVVDELGKDIPVHFSRFFPQYKLAHLPPTPLETMDMAYRIAREEGLKFVYVGNVPGHAGETTYCPECGKPLIVRRGFEILEYHLTPDGKCEYCGADVPVIGSYSKKPYKDAWW